MTKLKKLAAIDIGTNSFHLVIAQIDSPSKFTIIDRMREIVRLSVSSTDMKYITTESTDRAIEVLKRFKSLADIHAAEIKAVATSAVREALNKSEFIRRVKSETDIDIDVISGCEEARLIYMGSLQALPIYNKDSLVVDIGGGSTEFILGKKGNILFSESLKMGSVRYTKKYFSGNILNMKDVYACREEVRGMLNPISRSLKDKNIDIFVGSSGTIMNIAAMVKIFYSDADYLTLNHYTFTKKELSEVINLLLSRSSSSERAKLNGLDPGRSDIIVAGALILEQIFSELKIPEMTVSDYALREGVVLDIINKTEGTKKISHYSDIRFKSIINLMEQSHCDIKHAKHVTDLSLQMFDQLKNIHKLNDEEREYLEAAGLLHDIGYHISHSQHHRHSYYLIRNSELLGFSDREIEIIANISRYHRKSHPKIKHEGFNKLSPDDQEKVTRLASMLRIADGLDRTHKTLVSKIQCKIIGKTVKFELIHKSDNDFNLDIWGSERKKLLFEDTFGYKVKLSY